MAAPRVVVVGSLNLDVVYQVARLPKPGETAVGTSLRRFSGGKGGNQAHAAARLALHGIRVSMIGGVGSDEAGSILRNDLLGVGVDVTGVAVVHGPSGTATITVDENGLNTIVVVPGANSGWTNLTGQLGPADIVAVQLEIPLAVVARALKRARGFGARTILNAAPLDRAALDLLPNVSILVVNEAQARGLFDLEGVVDEATVAAVLDRIPCELVVTMGPGGALVATPDPHLVTRIRAFPVDAVDTVGAGDAFVGAMAAALADGDDLVTAARHGVVAGALTTTVHGARHPHLSRGVVEAFVKTLE